MTLQEYAGNLLSFLEEEEAKFLSWGYVDGGFTEPDVHDKAYEWLSLQEQSECPHSVEELIDTLSNQKMLLELNMGGRTIWRTRMAETVRLLARLRQRFDEKDWNVAPTLVSDFRFGIRKRRYPERNITTETVIEQAKRSGLASEQLEILATLLSRGEPDKPFLLSPFQVRAAMRMFSSIRERKSQGMIVLASTGTGKTLSFYLPALTSIADQIEQQPKPYTKAIALYPRSELLKDQFMETYEEARKLDARLKETSGRKLLIGAFYGDTPKNHKQIKWKDEQQYQGYLCPYFICPDCGSEMVWIKQDAVRGYEALSCTQRKCAKRIESDEIVLTRERMRDNQPDVLFTTTEMLNRLMSNKQYHRVIGIGAEHPVRFMLLDEVHTYTGVHGAQVALLIRRWHNAVTKPVHFTGLSATLEEPVQFFAQLTGLGLEQVTAVDMHDDPLIQEGREYQLILRGDPTSNASLLSTTIQTIMLMRRMLDVDWENPSNGWNGKRVFVFTDDLDVTNRLYDDLKDAEGQDSRRKKDTLARLRDRNKHAMPHEESERAQEGQLWDFPLEIGHDLSHKLDIGRTSSQDKGVNPNADVIVATASLEVGYNDPFVGAVIQHKAPLDMASFLQRKGRAGRKRSMRPWTITVLSDYGRDRTSYQFYEAIFDPKLQRRDLPIHNRYVLRMQAVYCLMDYLSEVIEVNNSNVWFNLSQPASGATDSNVRDWAEKVQKLIADTVASLLDRPHSREEFKTHLRAALNISDEQADALFWESPRSLMLHVLPTMLRRLRKGWKRYDQSMELWVSDSPLPEFIPSTLFSDLSLPEVLIELPLDSKRKSGGERHDMQILPALKSFAPGRATRRFGIHRSGVSHWVQPPSFENTEEAQYLEMQEFYPETEELGEYQYETDGRTVSVRALRPLLIKPALVPREVKTTSNAFLIWKTQIFPAVLLRQGPDVASGLSAELPAGSPWLKYVQGIQFYTHTDQSPVTVRRFALGSDATIRMKDGKEVISRIRYSSEEQPVALGFSQEVDAIRIQYQLPNKPLLLPGEHDEATVRSYRTALFRHLVRQDERLSKVTDIFARDLLSEAYLDGLIATASKDQCSLVEANSKWNTANWRGGLDKVFAVVLRSVRLDEAADGERDDDLDEADDELLSRSHQRMKKVLEHDVVFVVLHELATVLWDRPDHRWQEWAEQRWLATLGGAVLQACKELASEFGSEDLRLDISGGSSPLGGAENPNERHDIWITENTSGGGGVIEEVIRGYQEDPRRFFRLVESALGPSDFELADTELSRTLHLAIHDQETANLLEEVRLAENYREQELALQTLQNNLQDRGTLTTHTVMSSIFNRILKPASSRQSDQLLYDLIETWNAEEARLGVELDARVFAYVASASSQIYDRFQAALAHIDSNLVDDENWRYQLIYSLIWARGNSIRSKNLSSYNPYVEDIQAERMLLLRDVSGGVTVDLSDPDRMKKIGDALLNCGTVRLRALLSQHEELRHAILQLLVNPIEIEYLHLYPRVEGLQREGDHYLVALDLREAIQ
ncbi:helicase-like protein [Tumebacillus sp. BK434]|uniref:protein DpdJ n=1 Tax=Tumebacillus sp. BK434 TaxID=2512169 RepID=UPI0010486163|nr:protein DpdJ [Tumebacillus sp. BK434]TCP53873.1 helicase-like protein [Tumebacillus sp. BK434]